MKRTLAFTVITVIVVIVSRVVKVIVHRKFIMNEKKAQLLSQRIKIL